jgi:hypothetical protein
MGKSIQAEGTVQVTGTLTSFAFLYYTELGFYE